MSNVGFVRKLDVNGRITLPKEILDANLINSQTPLEILVDGNTIILKEYSSGCIFCGGIENIKYCLNKPVCTQCLMLLEFSNP